MLKEPGKSIRQKNQWYESKTNDFFKSTQHNTEQDV